MFSSNPQNSHETAIKKIGRYLKRSKDKGIILKVKREIVLELCLDLVFAGGWNQNNSGDQINVISRTEYVFRYMGCTILWYRMMQNEVDLIITGTEYIALLQ